MCLEKFKKKLREMSTFCTTTPPYSGERKDAALDVLDVAVFEQIIRINLFGMMYCSKAAIPLLKKRGGGSIINTSSSCGLIGIPNCDAYSASKGATISLTRSMAVIDRKKYVRTVLRRQRSTRRWF